MAFTLEPKLHEMIAKLHQSLVDATPEGGFSSPRDIALVTEVNKHAAVFSKLEEAMQILNPNYTYSK